MHLKPGSNIKALNLAYGLVTLDQGQGVDFLEVFLFVVCVVVQDSFHSFFLYQPLAFLGLIRGPFSLHRAVRPQPDAETKTH